METTTPAKKGNGLVIAFVVVLALGIGTAVAYTMRKKSGSGSSASKLTTGAPSQKSGWTQADKSEYKRDAILNSAQSVKEENNRLVATLSSEQAKKLFGNEKATKVFLPKPTGNQYNASPEILAKLKAKYGDGTLYQKGANMLDGFDYITAAGEKIFVATKDLFDMAKMNNDTGDIMNSSFYNN